MKRKDAIALLTYAGYHEDSRTWTRIYCENRVSVQVAREAWRQGQKLKAKGMPCGCRECRNEANHVR